MKGPYERLKYDFRRQWECPKCGHRRWSPGAITSEPCDCTMQETPPHFTRMRLAAEGGRRTDGRPIPIPAPSGPLRREEAVSTPRPAAEPAPEIEASDGEQPEVAIPAMEAETMEAETTTIDVMLATEASGDLIEDSQPSLEPPDAGLSAPSVETEEVSPTASEQSAAVVDSNAESAPRQKRKRTKKRRRKP